MKRPIKTASKKSCQPCHEHLLSEKDQKYITNAFAKHSEEIIILVKNSDDSYHDAP